MLRTDSFRLDNQYCHLYQSQFIFSQAAELETVPESVKKRPGRLKQVIYIVLILLLITLSGFGFQQRNYYPAGMALATALVPALRLIRAQQEQHYSVIPFSWIAEVELHRNFPRGRMLLILRFSPPGQNQCTSSYTLAGPLKDGNPELEKAYTILAENFLFLKVT